MTFPFRGGGRVSHLTADIREETKKYTKKKTFSAVRKIWVTEITVHDKRIKSYCSFLTPSNLLFIDDEGVPRTV